MIPGVIATEPRFVPTIPPAPSGAVRFSGLTGANGKCAIKLASITSTNNGFLGWAGWFKTNWYPTTGTSFPNIWVTDHAGAVANNFHRNGTTQWEFDIAGATLGGSINIGAADSLSFLPSNDTQWRHIIAACDVNHATLATKIMAIFVNGVDATANKSGSNTTAWTFPLNGKDFWIGDNGFGDSWLGDVYDFSFWPGVNLLTGSTISPTTLALFRSGGAPVAPSVAIAALGSPAIMLTGGPSGFLANSLGTSGALTVPAGYDSPTNATTHP